MKLAAGVKERTAAQEALQKLQRDLEGASKEKATLFSEHESLKDMLEALRSERAKLAEALEVSKAKLAATEAQRTEQAERAEQLQQELGAAVAGREATDRKLADLESQLVAATLQHKSLSKQCESAHQGSRHLQAQLEQAQATHKELSNNHSKAQDTIRSLLEKVARFITEKESLAHDVSNKTTQLKEAAEAAERAQEEGEAQITDAAKRAAEEREKQQFRIKKLETELLSSKTQLEESEALLKAAEASGSVLRAKLADAQSKVIFQPLFCCVQATPIYHPLQGRLLESHTASRQGNRYSLHTMLLRCWVSYQGNVGDNNVLRSVAGARSADRDCQDRHRAARGHSSSRIRPGRRREGRDESQGSAELRHCPGGAAQQPAAQSEGSSL